MVRILALLLLVGLSAATHAADLRSRLLLLYPGEEAAAVETRAYLTGKLENVFRQLRYTDRITRKSTARQVSLITDRLYRGTLRRYASEASLSDAFANGTYNDATATQLLALTFEHFNISYAGYVDHWESYLVVSLPATTVTLRHPTAEARAPEAERSYRREYLALLRSALELPLAALDPTEADSVFYQYYYRPTQRLDFRQLAAYGQYRRAERAYRAGDFTTTRSHLTTALSEDWQPAFYLLARAATLQESARQPVAVERYLTDLFDLWQQQPNNAYLPAALLQYFDTRQQQLLASNELDAVMRLPQTFGARAPSGQAAWRAELRVLQQLRLLNYYQLQGKPVLALQIAEALLERAPENTTYQGYVAELTLVDLRRRYPDPGESLAHAIGAARERPWLRGYDRYADIILRDAALTVRDRFAANQASEAEVALAAFRSKLTDYPNGHDRTLWTLTAFIAASNYYFAAEDYGPARAYLQEALRYDPANAFLLHQQQLLARY